MRGGAIHSSWSKSATSVQKLYRPPLLLLLEAGVGVGDAPDWLNVCPPSLPGPSAVVVKEDLRPGEDVVCLEARISPAFRTNAQISSPGRECKAGLPCLG